VTDRIQNTVNTQRTNRAFLGKGRNNYITNYEVSKLEGVRVMYDMELEKEGHSGVNRLMGR
jgi:hypothetical protein